MAALIGAEIDAPVVSFGSLIRSEQPEGATRERLQEAGSQMLDRLGPPGLRDAALQACGVDPAEIPVIWEGIRHRSVLEAVADLYAPKRVLLFMLAPPEQDRRRRASAEAGSEQRLARWEEHETESLGDLAVLAELRITAPTPQAATEQILAHLAN
ncbi:MAG TPA: hypothetical protein VIH47_04555 [Solirubrobacterales bacterium]